MSPANELENTIPDAQPSCSSSGFDAASVVSEAPSLASVGGPSTSAGTEALKEAKPPSGDSELMAQVMGDGAEEPNDEDEKCPKGSVTCHRCKQFVDKNEAQIVGSKSKKVFRCNLCNALTARMARLLKKSGTLAKDWCMVSDEERQLFYEKSKELQGAALQEGMESQINFSKKRISRVKGGANGHQIRRDKTFTLTASCVKFCSGFCIVQASSNVTCSSGNMKFVR